MSKKIYRSIVHLFHPPGKVLMIHISIDTLLKEYESIAGAAALGTSFDKKHKIDRKALVASATRQAKQKQLSAC